MAKILAIESSCDETAASIVEDGRHILSDVVYSQAEIHAAFGGVVPEIASRNHINALDKVVNQSLLKANLTFKDIDAIGVTNCPGLVGALLTGLSYAKGLSYALDIPLIGVHHIKGHIAANYIADKKLKPPFLCLVVSGGHTQIIHVKDYLDFEILAKTRDDAVGEAFDKVARVFALPYPGGVKLDKIAQSGDHTKMTFTKPKMGDTLDFSFSGIKTAVNCYINKIKTKPIEDYQNDELFTDKPFKGLGIKVVDGGLTKADIAASFSYSVSTMLTEPLFYLARELNMKNVCIAGGVSANSFLRKMFLEKADKFGINAICPPLELCGDNAAMIGSFAYYKYINNVFDDYSLNAIPFIGVDEEN